MSVEYFQGGALFIFDPNKRIRPFLAFTVGATHFNPKESGRESDWRFSVTFGGGAKFFLTPSVGIRLQARILMPIYFDGGSIYCGSGGCGLGLAAGTYLIQADLTGGVFIAFGR